MTDSSRVDGVQPRTIVRRRPGVSRHRALRYRQWLSQTFDISAPELALQSQDWNGESSSDTGRVASVNAFAGTPGRFGL
jgi:hypothetical protein